MNGSRSVCVCVVLANDTLFDRRPAFTYRYDGEGRGKRQRSPPAAVDARSRRTRLPGTILGPLAVARPVPYVTCDGVALDDTMLICSRSADWPWCSRRVLLVDVAGCVSAADSRRPAMLCTRRMAPRRRDDRQPGPAVPVVTAVPGHHRVYTAPALAAAVAQAASVLVAVTVTATAFAASAS